MIENIEDFEKNEVRKILLECHIPLNWLGFKYLVTAIPYVIDKIQSNEKIMMGELYQFIARNHKTTSSKVERAIRYVHNEKMQYIVEKMKCERITNQIFIVNLAMSLMEKFNWNRHS